MVENPVLEIYTYIMDEISVVFVFTIIFVLNTYSVLILLFKYTRCDDNIKKVLLSFVRVRSRHRNRERDIGSQLFNNGPK